MIITTAVAMAQRGCSTRAIILSSQSVGDAVRLDESPFSIRCQTASSNRGGSTGCGYAARNKAPSLSVCGGGFGVFIRRWRRGFWSAASMLVFWPRFGNPQIYLVQQRRATEHLAGDTLQHELFMAST